MSDYTVYENSNPVISPVRADGKQEIGVHDYDSGNRRYIITDSKNVDEFISKRKNELKKANILGAAVILASVASGILIGENTSKRLNKNFEEFEVFDKVFGGFFGLMAGSVANVFINRSADKKVTQEFIEKNK